MHGFSLLELSIVLVIIGLLAGGVMTGQSLIRAAEVRAVSTEYQKYATALHAFRDKYRAYPGDMKNATSFWGIAAGSTGNDATCRAAAGTGTATCNGDGDGVVGRWAVNDANELFRFWEQLANAGLIEGTYSGIATTPGTLIHTIGVTSPTSKIGNAGWSIDSLANDGYYGEPEWFLLNYGTNTFVFGTDYAGWQPYGVVVTPAEAWSIDTKLDDGKPGFGKVIALIVNQCTEAVGYTASDIYLHPDIATYRLTNNAKACSFSFKWR